MSSGVFMVRNKENGKYYVCCSQNMKKSYRSIIRSLKKARPWYEISDIDIINLRNKIPENKKYEDVQSLKNIKFCQEELTDILKNMDFTEREIVLVVDYTRKRERRVLNTPLVEAFEKYGEEAFEFIVLEKCNAEVMYEVKSYWMKKLDCTNRELGYNVSPCVYGHKISEDAKERRKKFYETDRGKKLKEETRARTIEFNKHRKKGLKRKPLTEEAKRKISESQKKNYETEKGDIIREASRQRLIKLNKSRKGEKRGPLPEETKRKQSESLKKFWINANADEAMKEERKRRYREKFHKFMLTDKGKKWLEKSKQRIRNVDRTKKSKEKSEEMI